MPTRTETERDFEMRPPEAGRAEGGTAGGSGLPTCPRCHTELRGFPSRCPNRECRTNLLALYLRALDGEDLERAHLYLVESAKQDVIEWQRRRRVPTFVARSLEIAVPVLLGGALFLSWQDYLIRENVRKLLTEPESEVTVDWSHVRGSDGMTLPAALDERYATLDERIVRGREDLDLALRSDQVRSLRELGRRIEVLEHERSGEEIVELVRPRPSADWATSASSYATADGLVPLRWRVAGSPRPGERSFVLVCSTDEDFVSSLGTAGSHAAVLASGSGPQAQGSEGNRGKALDEEWREKIGGTDFERLATRRGRAVVFRTAFPEQKLPLALLGGADGDGGVERVHWRVGIEVSSDDERSPRGALSWSEPASFWTLRRDEADAELAPLGVADVGTGALSRIYRTQRLHVGIGMEPTADFCYWDPEQGAFEGLEPRILRSIRECLEDALGFERGGIRVQFHHYDWEVLLAAPSFGEVDMIVSTISNVPRRKELYGLAFSQSYYETPQCLISRRDERPERLDDLAGRDIAFQRWTTSETCAERIRSWFTEGEAGQEGRNPDGEAERAPPVLRGVESLTELTDLVERGEVRFGMLDHALAERLLQDADDAGPLAVVRMTVLADDETCRALGALDEYCFALPADEHLLRRLVSWRIRDLAADGVLDAWKSDLGLR